MKLSDMQLFRGLKEEEIASLLSCLSSVKRNYKKGEVILSRREHYREYRYCVVWYGNDIL